LPVRELDKRTDKNVCPTRIVVVAIGWGKSFEEQIEEAGQRASTERAQRLSLEDRVRQQRLASLKLSRSRIEDQLAKAVHPAHREMLMKGLQALEREAEEISKSTNKEQ
jgi:hypothetical protein